MQAGGVLSYGVPAVGFLASWVFKLNIMERLGMIMMWVIMGVLFAHLSFVTVFSYFITAGALYTDNMGGNTVTKTEIWVTWAVYTVVQAGFGFLLLKFGKDTILYLVAGELEKICEKYGAFCTQMGVLPPAEDNGDDFEETEGTSLVYNFGW